MRISINLVRNLSRYLFTVSPGGTWTELAVNQFKVYLIWSRGKFRSFVSSVCLTSLWLFSSRPRDYLFKFTNSHHVLIITGTLLPWPWDLDSLDREMQGENTTFSTAPTQMIPRRSILDCKSIERDFDKMLALVLKSSHLKDIDTYMPWRWLSVWLEDRRNSLWTRAVYTDWVS